MEQLFKMLLFAHAFAGGVALITGTLVMIQKKSTELLSETGLVFFYAVLVNALYAFYLSVYHPNLFLFSLEY